MDGPSQCRVCLGQTTPASKVELKCHHIFCGACLVKYIETLRAYRLLTPQKLSCLQQNCKQQIQDAIISKLFPGEQGFIFNIIKKRYRQSKDPNITIFDCTGYITLDRKLLIAKSAQVSKQQHAKALTQLCKKIINGEQTGTNFKTCKNIISFNKSVPRKENYIQCNVCNCFYCISCLNLQHDGTCAIKSEAAIISKEGAKAINTDEIDNFVQRNGILRCLNPKCRVAIAKEEGCFWIKCRCSWEMCYPCQKLWGDCEHFKNYPYKKFVPPPEWMVKALNLY